MRILKEFLYFSLFNEETLMKKGKFFILILGFLGLLSLLALPLQATAKEKKSSKNKKYTIEFESSGRDTAPEGASAKMTIKVDKKGYSTIDFKVKGAYPNVLYTIWIAFYNPDLPRDNPNRLPSDFPTEGCPVAPLARLDDSFTSGMGVDPGAAFYTDKKGNGKVKVKLDYNILEGAPVGNGGLIYQCVPGPMVDGQCTFPSRLVRVTTTWLREYIGQMANPEECANYDADYDYGHPTGPNTLNWQCIDPDTGLPKVVRRPASEPFHHFRLANHLDGLTHGFIGGDKADHQIDMIGRLSNLVPEYDDDDEEDDSSSDYNGPQNLNR